MTRMIPPTIHSSVQSGAERRLFSMLRSAPGSEDWVCLHSLGLARHDNKRRAEIDFLLLTPLGVFVIEVKGGRIRREHGEWIFTDKYATEHRKSEGPFAQASSAMFAIERAIRRELGDAPWRDVLFGYGVAFPDVEFTAVGTDGAQEIVYDARDRSRPFVDYVRRLAGFARAADPRPRRGLTRAQIAQLSEFLRGDFDLVPTFEVAAAGTRAEIETLTKEQTAVLDAFEDEDRLLVDGPAGSGKTILALEAARRDARAGRHVLFLCFNRLLAARVSAVARREEYAGRVDVSTVHGYFRQLIEASTLRAEFEQISTSATEDRLFGELFPEYAAMAAMEQRSPPVDVLIIDEAQDVLAGKYLATIAESLRGGIERGRWRIFLDANNQASLYGCLEPALLSRLRSAGATSVLTINCRNTRPIALQTNVVSEPRRRAEGRVEGVPVEFISYSDEQECSGKLERVLNDLAHQGVPRGQISVLFVRHPNDVMLRRLQRLGVRPLDERDVPYLGGATLDATTWSQVSRFKGLENDVVILVGVTDIEGAWWRAATYVGMSRARVRLWVLLHTDCDSVRRERLQREAHRLLSTKEELL